MMDNRMDHTKIKTFERLFRSLKYEHDQADQKMVCEEFCTDIRNILEEMKHVRAYDGISKIIDQNNNPGHKITENQYMVLCGSIGIGGTILMAKYFHKKLHGVFPAWMMRDALGMEPKLHLYPMKELLEQYNVSAIYAVGEGGLRRVLYQLGKDTGRGFEVQARQVPVNQITIEFCEYFDLDPWNLLSGGCTLLICSQPSILIQELRKMNIPAEVIGIMAKNKDKVITYGITRSLVNRPKADALLTLWLEERKNIDYGITKNF